MELKQIISRYEAKCAGVGCGRELHIGWEIFFDPETKKVYCKYCLAKIAPTQKGLSETTTKELPDKKVDDGLLVDLLVSLSEKLDTISNILLAIQAQENEPPKKSKTKS